MFAFLNTSCLMGKHSVGDIATIDVWFKNISLGIKVKTNGSKERNLGHFSFSVDKILKLLHVVFDIWVLH